MSMKTLLPLVLVCGCSEHGKTPEPFGVPITGGTMMVTADGSRAVIADPDRDRVLQVNLATETVISETALQKGDEPGRLVEDAAGRIHVGLRHGGALLTLDATGAILDRRPVCAEPRGVAYDAATDRVHVACSGGELVTFAAAGGLPVRALRLDHDLRDVVVAGDKLKVTRFRTAEVLTLDATGQVIARVQPPTVPRFDFGGIDVGPGTGSGGAPQDGSFPAPASTAWRTIALSDGRLLMSHQRRTRNVLDSQSPGGYGGQCGGGPVEDAITVMPADNTTGVLPQAVARIGRGALPVDIAVSRSGDKIAVATAGAREVTVVPTNVALSTPDEDKCDPPDPQPCGEMPTPGDDTSGGGGGAGSGGTTTPTPDMGTCCEDKDRDGQCDDGDKGDDDNGDDPQRLGPPTSLGWTPTGDLLIYYPEAPAIVVRSQGTTNAHRIELSGTRANDAGRNVFHRQTRIGLACASCHPEGRDDGIVWLFASDGARRTQSLAGNILERAPYHWTGDENSLPVLMDDVFSKRMSGGTLNDRQKAALGPWLNRVPAPAPLAGDPAAIARGEALFEAPNVGCVSCHNGPLFTNNMRFNVGTGGNFKVPSLVGVGSRPPFLHTGCATTLMDRFTTCAAPAGVHGDTSKLTPDQLKDLVAYLESL